jgi:Skp family chaperone for outer membrane proteins
MRVVGTVFLLMFMAASLAFPHGGRDYSGQSSPAGAVQTLRVPATRFAYFDGEYLAQKGVSLKMNSTRAALSAFGTALNVELFDVAQVMGKVFVADSSVDISDAFVKALKSKSSGAPGLTVPALNVPPATVAFINTEAFGDAQTGVTSLVKAFSTVEQEFKPRKEELQKLREELAAASDDRKQKLETEIGRKQAASQAALDKRVQALTGPVYQDIGRALTTFCKQHGITLIFDTSKIERTDTLPPFDLPLPADAPDVTRAFVTAYNQGELKP